MKRAAATTTSYSELQFDGLRELANIASGTAATALSTLLGEPVGDCVPVARVLPLADAVEAAGDSGSSATVVLQSIFGDVDAILLLLFRPTEAAMLCGLLGVEAESELALSAIGEIGNILGSAYIGAFATMTGLDLRPRPPETVTDMLGAIVASVLALGAEETDTALMLDSQLTVEGSGCSVLFILVPSRDGIHDVLAQLGLAE